MQRHKGLHAGCATLGSVAGMRVIEWNGNYTVLIKNWHRACDWRCLVNTFVSIDLVSFIIEHNIDVSVYLTL